MQRICIFLIIILAAGQVPAQEQSVARMSPGSGSFGAGAIVGPSRLLEKAPDSLTTQLKDYINKLRSGWHYGFETEYFFNEHFGIGAKYTRFNTRQEVDSIVVEIFSKIYYFELSSAMSIHNVSPMVYGRLPLLHNKLSVISGIGPAWLFYRNIGKAIGDTAMLKGSSPGLSASLRVSYEIIPNLNVGLQGSYIYAILKEFTKDDGTTQQVVKLEKEYYQNISRIDLSFGVFYTFRLK
jgi:hypothetical protein